MLNKLKNLAKTALLKTLFFSTVSTVFRAVSGMILNKVVAAAVGPVGLALVGQFTNFFGIAATIGSAGVETGVVRNVAQSRGDDVALRKIICTAALAMAVCSLLTGCSIFLLADYYSVLLFKSTAYVFILRLTGITLVFVSLKGLLMAVLNGRKQVVRYTWVNVIISSVSLVLSLLLVVRYKLPGVLAALILCQCLGFIITLFFTAKELKLKTENWTLTSSNSKHGFQFPVSGFKFKYFDLGVLKNLSAYSLMTLVGSFSLPLTLLVVRNYIGSRLSWPEAGYWQGVWMITEGYQVFIISALSFYYLPRLSEITDPLELRAEIIRSSKITLPLVTGTAIVIFMIRRLVVNILFTPAFAPMLPLFKYQLAGEVIRIAGWLVSYQMISKGMTRLFIFSALLFNFLFVVLSFLFIRTSGLEGVSIAFFVNAVIYLLFMLYIFRESLFIKEKGVNE